MAPPPGLRKRLQEDGRSSGVPGSGLKAPKGSLIGLVFPIVCALIGVFGLYAYWSRSSSSDSPPPEVHSPEVTILLRDANEAIHRKYDYNLAMVHLEQAVQFAPASADVKQLHGSVLISLGRLAEALEDFRFVFGTQSRVVQDAHFLQQYVLTLHRLGKQEELKIIWPKIAATPGVEWPSPLQCPDHLDATLLDGAVPFPEPTGLRVPELLLRHSAKITDEFAAFRTREPDWDSKSRFQVYQDNDLVHGNDQKRWTEMLLFSKGAWDARNCLAVPTVCRVLRNLPEIEGIVHGKRSGQVSLLKLLPNTTLVPHFGSVNWRYVAHFGLLVPEGVEITAGDETRSFEPGKVIVLDDSFLHSVDHKGASVRVTVFVNFFHPKTKPISYDEFRDQRGD